MGRHLQRTRPLCFLFLDNLENSDLHNTLYRPTTTAPPDSFTLRVEPFHSRRARSP